MVVLEVELSPGAKKFQCTKSALFSQNRSFWNGPFGAKKVPGRCPRGRVMTGAPGERRDPMPPPESALLQRQQNRKNSPFSAFRSHSPLCCRQPHESKAPKWVGRTALRPPPPFPHRCIDYGSPVVFDVLSHERVSLLASFYTSEHVLF